MQYFDVVIVGAGPGGLAAAKGAKDAGANSVLLLEREQETGGILKQCIHDGFGLIRYNKQLTGPEYAHRALAELDGKGVTIKTGYIVSKITPEGSKKIVTTISPTGLEKFEAGSVVLAMGCRERTRGNIQIPGTRPAGVFTAGVVQNLVNTKNIMVGKRVVILGSGDVGLIIARRLTLEGAKVLAVSEVMSEPTGLARNISQCLNDFGIPLYLSHTISNIYGKDRVTGVDIAKVDENKNPIKGTEIHFDCDTLVLSVGLIPENEVSETAGVKLNRLNGPETDQFLQTSVPGIFSCGNSRKVMDLADYVSMQGELAGQNAAKYVQKQELLPWPEDKTNAMKKGLPEKNCITCVLCPNSCTIHVLEDGETTEGNRCKRGHAFALQELKDPERFVTTTVRVNDKNNPLVPVRSDKAVKLAEIQEVVKQISKITLDHKPEPGTVIAADLGANKVSIFTVG